MKKKNRMQSPVQATKESIGMLGIPNDASFCVQIPDYTDANLTKELVVIRTRPVKLKVRDTRKGAREIEREFVFVTFNGVQYRVLNSFKVIAHPMAVSIVENSYMAARAFMMSKPGWKEKRSTSSKVMEMWLAEQNVKCVGDTCYDGTAKITKISRGFGLGLNSYYVEMYPLSADDDLGAGKGCMKRLVF